MKRPLAAIAILLLALAARAGDGARSTDAPRPASLPAGEVHAAVPLPFDHDAHQRVFGAIGLTCGDCHGVGAAVGTTPDLGATCHGCHLQEVPKAGAGAPRTCASCHPARAELRPQDHDATWLAAHGSEARAVGATCRDCHGAAECLDCHERRGALSASPHPVGFRSLHGLEARVDPASCGSCHAQATCTACHADGALRP